MIPHLKMNAREQEIIHQRFDAIFQNNEVEFTTRLHQLWKAQTFLVKEFGREGLMILLDYDTRVYVDTGIKRSLEIMHYSEVPESCPWYSLRGLPLDQTIREIWKAFPIGFIDSLEKYCKDLFAIVENNEWFLAYAHETMDYNEIPYYRFLGGCQPDVHAKLPEELTKAGWKMPRDLQELYSVHSIFGDLRSALKNDITHCIPNAGSLETSLTFLEEYVTEWGADYTFFDLLPFCEDGAGNSQNFYRIMPAEGSYLTVDWDHETKEISGGKSLADFICFQFGNMLSGEG